MFNFKEEEDLQEKTTPRKRTPENDITSPCGVVTESSKTLIKAGA
jgi:hypothetical protein